MELVLTRSMIRFFLLLRILLGFLNLDKIAVLPFLIYIFMKARLVRCLVH